MIKCDITRGDPAKIGSIIKTSRTTNRFITKLRGKIGGQGVVCFAEREKDKKMYALKTLGRRGGPPLELIKKYMRLRDEAYVWITLAKHGNIVQAFWFDFDQFHRPYIVMEYVADGRLPASLSERLAEKGRLTPEETTLFALHALNGLIHAKEVVHKDLGRSFFHRDIKPGNLLIADDGALKITDFGLALNRGGTYGYMAPEQWDSAEVEEKSDVYGLGCVLHEMLDGAPPFQGTPEILKRKHRFETPGSLKNIPADLNALISRCLSKSHERRPDFQEMFKALRSIHVRITGRRPDLASSPGPLSAEDFNARGAGFNELGRRRKALACYDNAIELDPNDSRFYLNRANVRFQTGDVHGAIEDHERTASLNPGSVDLYLNRGGHEAMRKNFEAAMDWYRQGLSIAPNEPMLYVGMGNIQAFRKDYPVAEELFQTARRCNSRCAEAMLGLANTCYCSGDDDTRAMSLYEEAISLNPFYLDAYKSYRVFCEFMKRTDKLDELSQIIHILENA